MKSTSGYFVMIKTKLEKFDWFAYNLLTYE